MLYVQHTNWNISTSFCGMWKYKTILGKTSELIHPYGIDEINTTEIILGILTNERTNNITNHIILEAKYYMYVCKLEKIMPDLVCFIKH